jgi:DNA polymerase-3 subunit gamma/tau
MREIRENVRYRPARDRYKIFIVDEAHQITKEAFNALLKTLEEPPEWVIFLLCTTEANDIPNTIASRCQHFTFRSVDFTELVIRMKEIAAQEGIEADEDALAVIAQAGEGSVRDSLSALDQAIACCGRTLNVADVRSLLGLFGLESLRTVAEAVQNRDSGRMIDIVQELESTGKSLQHFCRELARYWRNLLVAKISGKPTRLIAAADTEQQQYLASAAAFSEEDLTRYLNLTLELYKELQTSLQPRLHLELGLVKLVQAGKLRSIEEALQSLGSEPITAPPVSATARAGTPRPVSFQAPSTAKSEAASSNGVPAPKPAPEPALTGDFAADLQSALRSAGCAFSADAVAQSEVTVSGSEILIRCTPAMMLALRDASVQRIASKILGKPAKVRLEAAQIKKSPAEVAQQSPPQSGSEDALRERALSDPGVKRFQELFPGAQIRTVRNLNE